MFSLRNVLPPNRISRIPYLKLFNACIQPILLYGADVWSMDYLLKNTTKWESSLINFLPEQVPIRYLKMVLGLHKSAVNIAVLSETGRFPLAIYAIKSTIRFWHHLVNQKSNTLVTCVKNAYDHSLDVNPGICNKLQLILNLLNFNHVWENQNTPSINGLTRAILLKLKEKYKKILEILPD